MRENAIFSVTHRSKSYINDRICHGKNKAKKKNMKLLKLHEELLQV